MNKVFVKIILLIVLVIVIAFISVYIGNGFAEETEVNAKTNKLGKVALKDNNKFLNELESNGIHFTRNAAIKYHLSEEDALGVIEEFIEQNKDNIKSIKVEQLLYTNEENEKL